MKKIHFIIDGKKIEGREGQTILEAAPENEIPTLCFHSDLKIKSNCRLCLVEIKERRGFYTACSTKAEENMEIVTDSPEIKKARKINLELIFAQHREECNDCVWSFNCQLLKLAKRYGVEITKFPDRKANRPIYQFGPALILDNTKCIDCRNCVDVCKKQGVGFLEIKKKGFRSEIVPSPKEECIYCGQCIDHCPAGALEAVGEFEDVEKPLQDKNKIVVFQFAPSIRTSIGEEFDLPYGSIVTGKLIGAIKKLGVDKVFDVSLGADFTTIEEAKELIKRLEKPEKLPMFTSCCPAWVRFVEVYYPEFVPNLTTVRSPHIILGGLIKTFWAQKEKISPQKITVVSVMPCVAKKYEIRRPELKINGLKSVDYVLTTRELAYLLKKHQIDLKTATPQEPDKPLGLSSGAGVIFGATGGVMEATLRTIYENITGKRLPKIEFKKVRGMEGIKKASIEINNHLIKTMIINSTGNAREVLEDLKKNPRLYDYVEVMACFGGCVGGGGQPLPVDSKIREKRAKGLYKIDSQKKIRQAHENPTVKKIYKSFFLNKRIISSICHTKFSPKKKNFELRNKTKRSRKGF